MVKRIAAIAFIFICTSMAWGVLGGTIFSRTYSSGPQLKGKVSSSWGAPQEQAPPGASYSYLAPKTSASTEDGKRIERTIQERVHVPLPLEGSAIDVVLDLEHRQKGLLWYSTYKVSFVGLYT